MKPLRVNSRASAASYYNVAVTQFPIRTFPIEDLYIPFKPVPAFMEEIQDSILSCGLVNPIIVVRLPREDVVAEWTARKKPVTRLPDRPVLNVVWGGANRLAAAEALGYTHIDCVLLPNFDIGMDVQDAQRYSYREIKEGVQHDSPT